jgi:MYXO-CTERM domain-containing protein
MKKFLSICFVLMIAIMPVMAQEEELGVEAPDPGMSVPVDGGLSLLLAAGVAYGAHRRRRRS